MTARPTGEQKARAAVLRRCPQYVDVVRYLTDEDRAEYRQRAADLREVTGSSWNRANAQALEDVARDIFIGNASWRASARHGTARA